MSIELVTVGKQLLMACIVRLWTIKPDVSIDGQEWKEICYEEEASGSASFQGKQHEALHADTMLIVIDCS